MKKKELVSVSINQQDVSVEKGALLIEAAALAGVVIPRLCYHKYLSTPADCGICSVSIEGESSLVPSCSTLVSEGMVVRTNTEEVRDTVQGVIAEKLTNHPLECPICDKAGECSLQQYTSQFGTTNTKLSSQQVATAQTQDMGSTLFLDSNRCIQCTRCVRFSEEITNTNDIVLSKKDDGVTVSVEHKVEHGYSGNLVDICPVGAITSKDFRFKVPVWNLKEENSICPGCARGCNTVVDAYRDTIHRIRPRENPDVNQSWMCDEGRLLYKKVHSRKRLKAPLLRKSGRFIELGWEKAFEVCLKLLRAGSVVGQSSASMANEDAFAFKKLLDKLGAKGPAKPHKLEKNSWEADTFLKHQDPVPNRIGADLFSTEQYFEDFTRNEKFKVAIAIEGTVSSKGYDYLIYCGTSTCEQAARACLILPVASWAEYDGTFTNFEGRVQRFHQAISLRDGILAPWKLFSELLSRLGGEHWSSVEMVFDAMVAESPFFQGLSLEELGPCGAIGQLGKSKLKAGEKDG